MKHILLVFIGGGCGAALRHLVSLVTLRWFGPGFPVGTLSVNVIGSLAMGLFIGWLVHYQTGNIQPLRYFVATGLLGGFTTFSAFSLDTAILWERGDTGLALFYVAVSVALSLAGIFTGLAFARQFGS